MSRRHGSAAGIVREHPPGATVPPCSRRRSLHSAQARLFAVSLAASLALAACDLPTAAPDWTTSFIIPGEATTMGVDELLPNSVSIAGSEFQLSLDAITFSRTLGEMCGSPCTSANGLTVPKPAFTGTATSAITMPGEVATATVTNATITVTVTNGFSFDALRPSATARGRLTMTARNGTTTLTSLVVDGTSVPFPPNTTLTRTLTVASSTISGDIDIVVVLESPLGDPVTVNTSQRLTVNATPGQVRLSQAGVRVSNRTVTIENASIDVEDIDDFLINRVQGGAIKVALTNPFSVQGTLQLQIAGVSKSLDVTKAQQDLIYTKGEMQQILRSKPTATMSASGQVNAAAPITVRPTDVLRLDSDIRLDLSPKED